MPVHQNLKINTKNTPELILQPRESKRDYTYDYFAFVSVGGKKDLFGRGGGISTDQLEAKNKAMGEALERYCGSKVNLPLKRASFHQIQKIAIDPKKLICFSDLQYSEKFAYKKYNPDQLIDWVKGYSITKKKSVFVPAFSVYLGYNRLIPASEHFVPTSSIGLAIQTSIEKAIIKGIFEIIERDAAMITWLIKKKVHRINLKKVSLPKLIYLRDKIFAEKLSLEVIVSTVDISIPSTIAIIFDRAKKIPYASLGLSTEIDLEESAAKSIEEALMIRNTLEILKRKRTLRKLNMSSIKNFLDHATFYSFPEHRKFWNFLMRGKLYSSGVINKKYGLKKHKLNNIKEITKLLEKLKKEVIYVDVTDDIVRKMGFRAVRVVMPEMQAMDLSYKARFLGGARLEKLARKKQLNFRPHPFA
ncbi:MAG: YcaO-like family protein [Nanoarchaeota archaeon]|nr:YcaO-like family protein [Nanoarchaeota archaeon]